jgi:hypothetical protein
MRLYARASLCKVVNLCPEEFTTIKTADDAARMRKEEMAGAGEARYNPPQAGDMRDFAANSCRKSEP